MTIALSIAESAVDLVAEKVAIQTLSISYSQPAKLVFLVRQPQHTTPFSMHAAVSLTDGETTLFEGFIEDIDPSEDSNAIVYTAYDPTRRAGREITVMSVAWEDDPTDGIIPGTGAVPRLIFNAKVDNDPDYIFERSNDVTVGEILQTILEDAALPLGELNADGFESTDLSALDYKPQEKVVFESDTIREAIDHVLQWEPGIKLIYTGSQWRFYNHLSASTVDLTLNDHTATYPVLSLQLDRSLDECWTAVKLFGPETLVINIVTVSGETLVPDELTETTFETVGAGSPIKGYNVYQVADSAKRRMGKMLPSEIYLNMGAFDWLPTRSPSLQASWDGGTTWVAIPCYFDFQQGIVRTGDEAYMVRYSEEGIVTLLGTQHYFPPDDVRLVYAYYDDPLSVRSPEEGYSGTANSDFGVETEKWEYHESLAIGYEYGTPYSSEDRIAQFQKLADRMLAERSNTVYIGGVTLDGLDYQFLGLNKRINLAGVDGDGEALTTGWESIGAYLTDVEYDFEESLTTLQFSSDYMELFGIDVDQLKKSLQIDAIANREEPQFAITNSGIKFYSNFATPEQKAEMAREQAEANLEHAKNMFGEGIFDPMGTVQELEGLA